MRPGTGIHSSRTAALEVGFHLSKVVLGASVTGCLSVICEEEESDGFRLGIYTLSGSAGVQIVILSL